MNHVVPEVVGKLLLFFKNWIRVFSCSQFHPYWTQWHCYVSLHFWGYVLHSRQVTVGMRFGTVHWGSGCVKILHLDAYLVDLMHVWLDYYGVFNLLW